MDPKQMDDKVTQLQVTQSIMETRLAWWQQCMFASVLHTIAWTNMTKPIIVQMKQTEYTELFQAAIHPSMLKNSGLSTRRLQIDKLK